MQRTSIWKLYDLLNSLYFCIKINIAFILGTSLGLVILGFGPSLLATNSLIRKKQKKEEPPFFKTFFQEYFKSFKDGNLLLTPYLLIISSDFFLLTRSSISNRFLIVMLLVGLVLLLQMVIISSTMYTYYSLKITDYYFKALCFLGYHLLPMLVPLGWLLICCLGSYYLPGIIPFLSFGIWAVINMGILVKIFNDNEEKLTSSN